MKCAVRDSSWITFLKSRWLYQVHYSFFSTNMSLVPQMLQRSVLDCILDDKKEPRRLSGELLRYCAAFIQAKSCVRDELVINEKFPVVWLERSNQSCSLSVSSVCTWFSLTGCLDAFQLIWFSLLNGRLQIIGFTRSRIWRRRTQMLSWCW